MSELIRVCPECGERTAVCLGDDTSTALFSCVSCDAEFSVPLADDASDDGGD